MAGTRIQQRTENAENVLLVEGQDDRHVINHICVNNKPMPPFHIVDKDGVPNLLSAISTEIKVSGRQALGIVVDADSDLLYRWSEVVDRLNEQDIRCPASPDPNGTIVSTPRLPRIGIWLMPNNQSSGEIEEFVQCMIPSNDPVWPRSERYIEDIPQEDRKFKTKLLKAKFYAWLSTRSNPGRMGAAIGANDLPVDGELGDIFVIWLRRLFGR